MTKIYAPVCLATTILASDNYGHNATHGARGTGESFDMAFVLVELA